MILNASIILDAHHDKGQSTHTSGARLKDQEGAAHGSKEGERDRGFVKEQKSEEAHDAAYDTKERKFYDGEQHKEEVKEEKNKATVVGQKEKQAEIVPVVSGYLDRVPIPSIAPNVHIPAPILESNAPQEISSVKPLYDNGPLINGLSNSAVTLGVGQKEKQAEAAPVVSGNLYKVPGIVPNVHIPSPILESNAPQKVDFVKPLYGNGPLINSLSNSAVTTKKLKDTPLDQIRKFKKDLIALMFPHLSNLYYY